MALGQVIGSKLGRHAAPGAGHPGAEHRHAGRRVCEQTQRVGGQAGQGQRHEDDRDRQILRAVTGVTRRRRQAGSDHADHDRRHRQVLRAPGVLVQHPLGEEHQHEQSRGERRLHDDQRRQQQRDDLQGPAEYRQRRAEQPARAPHEPPDERQAQVLFLRRFLGVHRLQGDP